jgi:hypothetical protein
VAAFRLVPMRSLGPDNDWKIAAALMSRHIGGGEVHLALGILLFILHPPARDMSETL